MRSVKVLLIVFLAVVMCVGFAAFSKQVLHMYSAFDVDETRIYLDAFAKAYPDIEVKWTRMSSGEVLARIRAEAANPQASIWFAGPSTGHIAAAQDGLLEPYKSIAWQYLPADFKDPDGYWAGFYTGFIGFATNTDFLAKNNLDPPTSWYDLLKPEFYHEISGAYAYTSGTAYTTLISILQAIGPEKLGFDPESTAYVKELANHYHHFNKSGSACVTEAGLGEVAIGIAFSHDVLAKGIKKGYPVTLSFPKEGTGYEIGAVSLIKGGPETELAKVFIDWLMTSDAQSLFQAWNRVPLNPEAELAEGLVTASQVALIPGFGARITWYGEHKQDIVDQWRDITGE